VLLGEWISSGRCAIHWLTRRLASIFRLGTIICADIRTRAPQVQYVPPRRSIPAFHFGQTRFSKSFQRCCRVDPLQRSRASAKYRQNARIFDLSKLFGMRKCVVTS
jgi:hypothetical protein